MNPTCDKYIVMKYFLAILVLTCYGFSSVYADKPAYRIYNTKGHKTTYEELLKKATEVQVILFGEIHDNPISHWLQYELTKDLFQVKQQKLLLAAEMFEADNQLLLNEYTRKFIRKKDFENEAKLWPNYRTDYAPLVDFARDHELKFIGSNVPRRYAAIVNYQGFGGLDSINAYQRALIAPLPIKFDSTLNCYNSMKSMFTGEGPMHQQMNLAEAQAIKDATMAWFLVKNIDEGTTVLHFNGAYHSDNYEGIVWYLKDFAKKFPFQVEVLTVTCVEQEDIESLSAEFLGRADFIICIPKSMTNTY